MRPPRDPDQYSSEIISYGKRSYTKTIFHGYVYRFLIELLNHNEVALTKEWPDLNDYALAHLFSFYTTPQPSSHRSSQYSYHQLQDLLRTPLPSNGVGQLLFLRGHLPGSWIASIGARYGIAPEFFRKHIHLWRSSQGPILYAVPTLPSVSLRAGISLRINTVGNSVRPLGNKSLASRRNFLPEKFIHTPAILTPAPGSSYARGYAYLNSFEFLIEQDISITIESDGDNWTAILWSDVGGRDLSHSQEFLPFIKDLIARSKSGHRWAQVSPGTILGFDTELKHPLPPAQGHVNPDTNNNGSFVQAATHLPYEFHLVLDHAIAAVDPLYALSSVFRFAASTSKEVLAAITKRYEIISSTLWHPKHGEENMNQLILYKHILDDSACRHEEVLRFLRSPDLNEWAGSLTAEQTRIANAAKGAVEADYEYLLRRSRDYSEHHQTAITILTSVTALSEANKQIKLATQVTKLTILATIFLPLSFCTSIFGMNFIELESLSIWIWVIVTLCIGVVTLVVYQWDDRHELMEFLGRLRQKTYDKMGSVVYRKPSDALPI